MIECAIEYITDQNQSNISNQSLMEYLSKINSQISEFKNNPFHILTRQYFPNITKKFSKTLKFCL